MEVGAVVVESNGSRVMIVTIDMAVCPVETCEAIRTSLASAAKCEKDAVLVNFNHSHALPGFPSAVKLGGEHIETTETEAMFAEYVVRLAVSAVEMAAVRLEPARMELGRSEVADLSVNRRERNPDGSTRLGWNPSGVCDRSVQTVCFRRTDHSVLASLVNFACHPVVLGRDVIEYSSDFVGAMRSTVKSVLGGECLFLQGAAGDILPLEGFFSHKGPEVIFGQKLAIIALSAILNPISPATVIEKHEFASTTPISLYRRVAAAADGEPATVSAIERMVAFPFRQLPSRAELEAELTKWDQEMRELIDNRETAFPRNVINYHISWARAMLDRMDQGKLFDSVNAPVQAIRIGSLAICGAPGEIFNEIGLAVKRDSPAEMTLYCGYTNGILGYFPTAEEYQYGGYEPNSAHRGYGQPAAFDPGCEAILAEASTELLAHLFANRSDYHKS